MKRDRETLRERDRFEEASEHRCTDTRKFK